MKFLPLIIAAISVIVLSMLRVMTATGSLPSWAIIGRPLLMVATVISLILSRQGLIAPGARWGAYQGNAPTRLLFGLMALILIPIALFAVYRLYYGPMISLANGNEQAF